LSGLTQSRSDPNTIQDNYPPFVPSHRKAIKEEVERRMKEEERVRVTGIKRIPPPRPHPVKGEGRVHLDGPETVYSLVPLSIKGMRWDTKKRVRDKEGNRTYDLISGMYEQKELYGGELCCVVTIAANNCRQQLPPTIASNNC